MIDKALKYLSCPFVIILTMMATSIFSLAMAYTAEFAFDLKPCILCLYQRIPFAIVIALGLIAFASIKFIKDSKKRSAQIIVALMGLSMAANSALAAFHTGVEQKWWRFGEEGCAVPEFSEDPKTLIDHIMSSPSVSCDEIAWIDPILGLSMANYNIIWCLGLALLCLLNLRLKRRTA